MSGPIVRSGPSPEFSKNWALVFGEKKTSETAAKKKNVKPKPKTKSSKKS
jgi:hypothetical protein